MPPDTEDGKIYAGKKTTTVPLETLPTITTNNYRQALSQISGLLVSEVSNESFASLNYRGIGDPHESFNLMLLQDGIPISADPYGYPAAYYQPPLESIETVEFVRGGAGLLYGPLPGGSLNFISQRPPFDKSFDIKSRNIFGSKNFFSTYNQIAGSSKDAQYFGFLHHRRSDGFRSTNSDYEISNGEVRLTTDTSTETSINISMNAYNADSGEAGGLGNTTAPGVASYNENRFQTTREYDRLRIERYAPRVDVIHEFDSNTKLINNSWFTYLRRYSKRQDLGGAPTPPPTFGGFALGNTNTIAIQEFYTTGNQTRVSHNYELGGEKHSLTSGIQILNTSSPFQTQKGDNPNSEAGSVQRNIDRNTTTAALFAENLFRIGKWRITPGLRVENIWQNLDENKDINATTPLRSTNNFNAVPLFGLGIGHDILTSGEWYSNISQGYRPVTYQDALPLGPGDTISKNLDETNIINYETGIRGTKEDWLNWDTSLFLIDFDNQVGRVGTEIQNVGRAKYMGADLALELDLLHLSNKISNNSATNSWGSLSWYGNISLLKAEFTKGPVDGKTPQYAPDYLLKTGAIWRREGLKVALLGNLIGDHFGDDANSTERYIPSFRLWDLTADIPIYGDWASITTGVNNIFDETYYSRVRGNGIEPGNPRNWYAGLTLQF
jgi:Fe(3+) dicitrate transport protein